MTFPVVTGLTSFSSAGALANTTITLPATINRGDLIIIFFGSGYDSNGPQLVTAAGDLIQYNEAFHRDTSQNPAWYIFFKRANGDEGGTVVNGGTVPADPGRVNFCYVVSGADEYTMPDMTATAVGVSSTNPNPGNNNAFWGAADNLWIAYCICSTSSAITGFPTNYSGNTTGSSPAAVGPCSSATAWRALNAASEDPGAWTKTSSTHGTATIVVRPSQPINHARIRHNKNYYTGGSLTDITVLVEGGNNTRLYVAIAGSNLSGGNPTLTLDPSGLNILLVRCTDGVTTSHVATGSNDVRWYTVPDAVPAGSYTLHGARTAGTGGWQFYWVEIEGTPGPDTTTDVIAVNNVSGTTNADEVSGTIAGQAGGLILAVVRGNGLIDVRTSDFNGNLTMGFGQIAGAAAGQNSSLIVGRSIAGSNTFFVDDVSSDLTNDTIFMGMISIGYVNPRNYNAPLFAAI